jgi:8-oxo-dGTP diphosphatase
MKAKAPNVGVGIIIRKNSETLLIRRRNVHGEGTWSTPGGYLEFGESPELAAAREAFEETGVKVKNIRFVCVTNDYFEDRDKHFITLWFESDYESGEALVKAEDELSEVEWFNFNSLPDPLFLSFENMINGNCYKTARGTTY